MNSALPPLNDLIAKVEREKIPALIAALAARLLAEASVVVVNDHGKAPVEPDTTLTVKEIAEVLHRTERWVWRNQKKLPFLRRVGGRGLIASRRDLDKWLLAQRIK